MKHLFFLFLAYFIWGLSPLYWRMLENFSPLTIVCFRLLGSLFCLFWLCLYGKNLLTAHRYIGTKRYLSLCSLSALLLCTNWTIFIYAISIGKTVEASLGYFILPIVTVLFGRVFFKEQLSKTQAIAVILCFIGIAISTYDYGEIPWLGLGLAFSFVTYTSIHKGKITDPLAGLFVESLLLAPVALFFVGTQAHHLYSADISQLFTLCGAGLMTAIPLFFYCNGVKKTPLRIVGFVQYLNPLLNLGVAVLVFKEPFTQMQLIAFCFIWLGIGVFLSEPIAAFFKKNFIFTNFKESNYEY